MPRTNELGQVIGDPVPDWRPPARPGDHPMSGRLCRVERLDPERHADDLFEANNAGMDQRNWTYLPYGPFNALPAYQEWLRTTCTGPDPMFHAVIDLASGQALGVASYLRLNPPAGSIEVGHINYSPLLQGTPAATETMFLMMQRAFELGYRRYEWKCDALNERSCAAARRLGFTYEGTFRQAMVNKGRNRDTAWFSVIDTEWPALKSAFESWLDPSNFDTEGMQKSPLRAFQKHGAGDSGLAR